MAVFEVGYTLYTVLALVKLLICKGLMTVQGRVYHYIYRHFFIYNGE